jgi:hypothetical protein
MFLSPSLGKVAPEKLIDQIALFLEQKSEHPYRLIIGSDSHMRGTNGHTQLRLVTAIIIHRVGCGGRYFWQTKHLPETKTLRDKIYAETMESLTIAQEFLPKLNKRLNGHNNYQLEIHIDVGRAGETREMIKEVVGIVTGNGYTAITKPDSYGASKVADKHT